MRKALVIIGAVVVVAGGVLVALSTMREVEEGPAGPLHHGDLDLSFEERARYHYEIEKARHIFRTGSAKKPFDIGMNPGIMLD